MTIICPQCKHHFFHVTPNRKGPERERFEQQVFVAPNGCWLWLGGHGKRGYPTFYSRGKTLYAHRVAWELYCGEIPNGSEVCHNCPTGDNPSCVNPCHLFLGSHVENMLDMHRKGRRRCWGEKARTAKLTEAQVLEIRTKRTAGLSEQELANEYGVLQSTVSRIVLRRSWKHLPA